MIEIRSYLARTGEILDFRSPRLRDMFMPLAECQGPLTPHPPHYIDGAIEITVDGRPLIGFEDWNDVRSLWVCLLYDLGKVSQGEVVDDLIPDSALPLRMQPREAGVEIEIQIGDRVVYCDFARFATAMIDAGRAFFKRMCEIDPENAGLYTEQPLPIMDRLEGRVREMAARPSRRDPPASG